MSAVLWNALMQNASQDLPAGDWANPADVSAMNVCDPSGMLPTAECPNLVSEVFLNGNDAASRMTCIENTAINRETGLLATVSPCPVD